jgi:glutamyl-Q tRNA(Asp) synthetase
MPTGIDVITRFAPSPTGRLHLGHAYSALLAHDFARERGGQFILRIEDIDASRCRAEFTDAIYEDLAWLGLDWDGEVWVQSRRTDVYQAALESLQSQGLVYQCWCTRAEIAAAASAPHAGEAVVYPGTCKGRSFSDEDRPYCWRLDLAKAIEHAHSRRPALDAGLGFFKAQSASQNSLAPCQARGDEGEQSHRVLGWHEEGRGFVTANPQEHGDIVIARKDAATSYHLAVTIDDAAQGVTDIIRGEDLFDVTSIHCLLQNLLGVPTPRYHHHGLLYDEQGERLAKRRNAQTIASIRDAGYSPKHVTDALRSGAFMFGIRAERSKE